MLKLYDEKKNTEKISSIISEMKQYKGIKLTAGKFGQDNRDWLVDKENKTISQSLSSIKHLSKKSAQDLYKAGQMVDENGESCFKTFTSLLRELQMNTCLDTRQIEILIKLNYFSRYGGSGKLMDVYKEFFEGEKKLTKTVKSFDARLKACENYEGNVQNRELPLPIRLEAELNYIGLCLTTDAKISSSMYYILDIDDKYGVKVTLYAMNRGTIGVVRVRKDDYLKQPFENGDCFELIKFNKSPKFAYRNNERVVVPGEMEIWAQEYKIYKAPNRKEGE